MEQTNIRLRRRTFGGLLQFAAETLRARVYSRLAEVGFPDIRPAHSRLFRNLTENGSRVSDLAERAQMTKQSMAYLADSLAAAGYVKFEPDPTDGRAKLVQLTARGRAASEALIQLSTDSEAAFADVLGAEEMRELRRLLELFVDRFSAAS
ncbi:MarR family transcriptional regulator [Rhodoblastus acidophilus]|uniref:MarR family transcriptional regulator n=1 Tax=Candidatus Rhodoblastus alkanivorans TaxID=2954117 RepID=A0ABS9ZC49_9HYPH|nr:MarR family transcriptional regulator [Candidatus Rhodoblastus alkanivorans]MCI4677203.1 MarR family transcriptional regulator [Candidatus Rhodoblastus alkanivorans]MCI4684556.1 MarR family transcriptional regulator [Candidatus Rhodoblastus alkanivorans]MDI4641877.1 MarR family transcriptional regulator [Rhodoblastus acidophilus]